MLDAWGRRGFNQKPTREISRGEALPQDSDSESCGLITCFPAEI